MNLTGVGSRPVPVTVWTPSDVPDSEPLPLLLAHDGPEYDTLAGLTQFCGAMIAAGRVPPHRVALAQPVLRDAWYSGSPAHLRNEAGRPDPARPALRDPRSRRRHGRQPRWPHLPARRAVVGAGPRHGWWGLLASGSFFTVRRDESEARYKYFGRITGAVQQVLDHPHRPPAPRRDDVWGPRGERREQPRHGRALRRAVNWWPIARSPTCTATWRRGAMPSSQT